jgi:hypothetical protein
MGLYEDPQPKGKIMSENVTVVTDLPGKNLLRRVVNKKTVITTLAVVGAVVVLKAAKDRLTAGEDASTES